jgi:hypothetical protein
METKVTERTTERARRRVAWIGALALAGTVVACKAKSEAKAAVPTVAADTVAPEPVEPAPAPVAAMPAAPAPVEALRYACDQYTIRESGVGAMEIGDAQDAFRTRCIVLSDSTAADPGDGTVRGTVVVGVNGVPVEVQIADGRVYRVTVSNPLFRTADGMGPGVSFVRLLDWPGAVVLEGEHDLSVVVNAHCGLYFRITKPATPPQSLALWADVVRAMPPDTPVERVVVRGCR